MVGRMFYFKLVIWFGLFAAFAQSSYARLSPNEQALVLYDCNNGDEQACLRAHRTVLFTGYLINNDARKQALELELASARSKCAEGQVQSCTDLGLQLFNQHAQDNSEAYSLFVKACDQGDGWACVLLGDINHIVIESASDNFRRYYLDVSERCEKQNFAACATQARLNVLILDAVPDKAIWYDQLINACENNISRACVNLSYLMSDDGKEEYQKFDLGSSVLDRYTKRSSFAYAKKACELGNPVGCWNVALAYSDGVGVRANWGHAQTNFVQACVAGLANACDEINYEIYWRTSDVSKDLELACAQGDFTACLLVTQRSYQNSEKPSQSDIHEYLERLVAICNAGSWIACANAAILYARAQDIPAAERLATVACNRDIGEACLVLGNIWKFNKDSEGHHAYAVSLLSRACELGSRAACNNLGDSYRKGLGVTKNLIRAKRYLTIACNKNLELACKNLQAVNKESQ